MCLSLCFLFKSLKFSSNVCYHGKAAADITKTENCSSVNVITSAWWMISCSVVSKTKPDLGEETLVMKTHCETAFYWPTTPLLCFMCSAVLLVCRVTSHVMHFIWCSTALQLQQRASLFPLSDRLFLRRPLTDVIKLQLVEAGLVECLLQVVAQTVDGEREEDIAQLKTSSDLMVLLLLGGKHTKDTASINPVVKHT